MNVSSIPITEEDKMTELVITFCDYCNRNLDIIDRKGQGYIQRTEEEAIADFGWKRTADGVKCQECQEKDEDLPHERRQT